MSHSKQDYVGNTVALAGRRTDAINADKVRFPLSNVEKVRGELSNLFAQRLTSKLVCSAACGADLIALDVADSLNIESHVVLPFSISDFRRISVTDLPGDWGVLYDRIISKVSKQGKLQILELNTEDDSAFSKANKVIIKTAEELSEKKQMPLGVVVWEGSSRNKVDATKEFLELAQNAKFDVVTILSK